MIDVALLDFEFFQRPFFLRPGGGGRMEKKFHMLVNVRGLLGGGILSGKKTLDASNGNSFFPQ